MPHELPNRVVLQVPWTRTVAHRAATDAVEYARQQMPRLSGQGAASLRVVAENGRFGIAWSHDQVWYQDQGIRSFVMRSLAGKTIPMWVPDDGQDPKAERRITADGRTQKLIFRKVPEVGSYRKVTRRGQTRWVQRAWPGSSARRIIARDAFGRILPGHAGIAWYHPGLRPKGFLLDAMQYAADRHGLRGNVSAQLAMGRWG